MHSLMIPCSFALLLLLLLLLFADAHGENLIEQVILPVDQPFDNNINNNNNNTVTWTPITIETDIIAAEKTYLMKLRVKTSGAEIETYAIPDTGSDLIWLNAKGCEGDACHCSNKNSKSKTTTNQQCIEEPKQPNLITCEDDDCKKLKSLNIEKECSTEQDGSFCSYGKRYEDGFTTKGKLGKGEFWFRIIDHGDNINSSEKLTDFNEYLTFGASNISKGRLDPESHGIVGLGLGELSLLKQNDRILPKFSYCLPNPKSSPKPKRKIKFGKKVDTSDGFSTQLLTKEKEEGGPVCEHRYCVHLATISLNDHDEGKIPVSETNKVMVIDSGSTFTYLANGLFDVFLDKVKKVTGVNKTEEFQPYYDNCFEESAVNEEKLKKVSFEFGGVGGSGTTKIELKRENFFDSYTPPGEGKPSYLCLTVVDGNKEGNNHARLYEDIARENGNSNLPHLLGNRAQMDFLVAFDLQEDKEKSKKKVVSFAKNCGEKENLELSVLSE